MSWKLNESSTTIGQPKELILSLKKHQLAMLYRCLTIEKSGAPYGFMSDSAGCGKTAVLISLILSDKTIYGKTQNLIIVPQNIISQWVSEIKKFSGDSLSVKTFIDYQDISSLYFDSNILHDYDILITTIMYYDTLMASLNGFSINRIIFDEIDTMDPIIKKFEEKKQTDIESEKKWKQGTNRLVPKVEERKVKSKITWFVSASLYNLIDEVQGFTFLGNNSGIKELGNVMVKCESQFIDKYNNILEKAEYLIYECESVTDAYAGLLSPQQLDYINSLSFQNIKSSHSPKIGSDGITVLEIIVQDYQNNIKKIDTTLVSLNKNRTITKDIQKQIDSLESDRTLYTQLIEMFHNKKCGNDCSDQINCLTDKFKSISKKIKNTKVNVLKGILKTIKPSDKLLIFSDFTGGFKILISLFTDYNIKYTELSKGNIKEIDMAINSYKNDDTTVLLIDSSNHGAGMNLENTSHLIFLHRTDETLRDQIIGRAQRPGRVGTLKIINLYNKNEIV
jgi:hypothetical protein